MNDLAPTGIAPREPFKIDIARMPIGLALYFDDDVYRRVRTIAADMADQIGFTPQHLIGKPAACVAVVAQSITWNLSPGAVAANTYMTPGGSIGYQGKLIHAILEASHRFDGPIKAELFGPWDRIRGKWKKATSAKGHEYAVPAWKEDDEEGLGVLIRGHVKKEVEPREFTMWLRECYPRNSTLWALRPSQQIQYTAMRAFGNISCPAILMGIPFDTDADSEGGVFMRDITPPPEPKRDPIDTNDKPAPAQVAAENDANFPPKEQVSEDGEVPFGPSDTFDLGRAAKTAGGSLYSVDPAWDEPMKEAFKAGWREREAELAHIEESRDKAARNEKRPAQ